MLGPAAQAGAQARVKTLTLEGSCPKISDAQRYGIARRILRATPTAAGPSGKQVTSDWKSWQIGRIAETADLGTRICGTVPIFCSRGPTLSLIHI